MATATTWTIVDWSTGDPRRINGEYPTRTKADDNVGRFIPKGGTYQLVPTAEVGRILQRAQPAR